MKRILTTIRKYPFSLLILAAISFATFCNTGNSLAALQNFDKLIHFALYAIFCTVLWYEYFRSHTIVDINCIFRWAFIAPIIFSGVLELLQGTITTYRTTDLVDFLFNALGVVFAAFLGLIVIRPTMRKYFQ